MPTENMTVNVIVDNEVPIDIKTLKNKTFCAIMELTEEEKVSILSKYAIKYSISL